MILHLILNHPETGQIPVPGTCSAALLEDFKKAATLINRLDNRSSGTGKARHFLLYLLHELFEALMEVDLGEQSVDEHSVIEDIKRYASEHVTDRLTLADLAKSAGYSPYHFHRMFLAEGITPRSFVEGQRLKRACGLLKKGHSVTSAAMDAGFASSSQFARVFKKQFQVSPTEWLKFVN